MSLQYYANNSGGSDWHTEEQWQKLLAVGWHDDDGLWKQFESEAQGMAEWQSIMNMDPDAEGCECCGPPHAFYTFTDEEWQEGQDTSAEPATVN